jgi:HEAT repeat protein
MKSQKTKITTVVIFLLCIFPLLSSVSFSESDQIDKLIQNLNSEYRDLRLSAIWTLGKVKDPRASDALIATLKHKDLIMRIKAAEALGDMKEPKAIAPLIDALKDEEDTVREASAKSLEKITGNNLGQGHDVWQKWWEQNKNKYKEK